MVSTPSAAGKRSIDAVSSKQSDISSKKDKADESVNNASASLNKRPKRACSSNLSSSNIQSDTATSTNVALQETSDSSNPTVAITENPVDSSHQPCYTNTKLPDTIKFDPTPVGATKFIAWNVAGLRASLKKDMMRYWSHCTTKKGYSGVMVLSKVKPLSVEYKMGHSAIDDEGRFVILEYQDFYYIGCYIMNAGADLGRLDLKREHYVKLKKFMGELQSKKPVIWSGDLNVAHTEIDLARPATNTK
ncbi:exodeoxyribonuclease III [Batrachochytrium dendrobatidis JEL423]|uniref:Exodeoxyribonuclease III n=1 Tax=Batrachochytrium dendrobatidis (strain JEL423) TaxID=403673 RepID=A0A177WY29_BATDL|nr:exodeoxyribonuclease III [Batrachochytrium dendrobatidis JEL423]